jgi:hypothetical protein
MSQTQTETDSAQEAAQKVIRIKMNADNTAIDFDATVGLTPEQVEALKKVKFGRIVAAKVNQKTGEVTALAESEADFRQRIEKAMARHWSHGRIAHSNTFPPERQYARQGKERKEVRSMVAEELEQEIQEAISEAVKDALETVKPRHSRFVNWFKSLPTWTGLLGISMDAASFNGKSYLQAAEQNCEFVMTRSFSHPIGKTMARTISSNSASRSSVDQCSA